ncbi:S10 family peptidase [Luteimonas abyssi]|uniref:S10 family peptidase n=1 Tax=Luteimonas abyssi TaxID=1247514 RepID=UPI000737BC89|nr:hypothetical protein [Luteimonas abyssi]
MKIVNTNIGTTKTLVSICLLALAAWLPGAGLHAAPVADAQLEHAGTFNGTAVRYVSRIETIPVRDGDAGADLVVMSHAATGADADPARPVLFAFNGGPISASLYLHAGALGPRRMAFPDDLDADPATFESAPNPHAILDVADIVLFDPAGTGFSRVADGTDTTHFHSVEADARQLVLMIEAWSRRHGREASPKYLLGESYGTLRAAAAAHQMQMRDTPMRVDGVFLLGQALNIIEYAQREQNIISYVVSLPTVAAIAWHHGRAETGGLAFEPWLDEVRTWARTEYLTALFQGQFLPEPERRRIAAQLQAYTGVDAEVLLREDLKLTKNEHRVELLRDRGQVLGVYDARYAGPPDPARPSPAATDPSGVTGPAFRRGLEDLLRTQFGVEDASAYRNSADIGGIDAWTWGRATSPFGDWPYMEWIREVMAANPDFRVVMGHGHHDTATTTGASDYAVAHSGWPLDRVRSVYYLGGHMPYTIEASLAQFADDLRTFVGAP